MNERARQAALLADVRVAQRGVLRPAAHRLRRAAAAALRSVRVRLPPAPAAAERLASRAPRSCSGAASSCSSGTSSRACFAGQAAPANPWQVGTLEWTVAVAAAAPQLRRDPDGGARAARVRQPRRARARQGLARPGRGAAVSRRRARCVARASNGAVGMAVFIGACAMLFAALLFAYAVVRARRRRGRRPGRRRSRAAPPRATASAARRRLRAAAGAHARPAWATGALGAGRDLPADAGVAVGAPGRRAPRPGDGRAGRRVLRAVGLSRAARAGRAGRDRVVLRAGRARTRARAGCGSRRCTWTSCAVVWVVIYVAVCVL